MGGAGTPIDLLRFSPLSLLQRVRFGWQAMRLQRTATWDRFENITAKDWLTQHMGEATYRVFWEPMLRGKFGEFYDQVSMTWIWGKIHLRLASRGKGMQKERLGYPMGSFGEVIDVLAQRIAEQGVFLFFG